jgi:hypothetical protein
MRRRDFIKGITVLTAWPVAARAQQTAKTHRIALVHPSVPIADMSESGGNPNYTALFKELRRLGYIEGVNLVVTRYSGEGQEERCGKMPSNWGSLSWAHPSRARSEAKNIAAYWEQWRRNMSTRSSSVIKQRT